MNHNEERRRQARRIEIERLSQQIEELSTRLNQLILDEHREDTEPDLAVGDRIEITNNHRGLRGTRGTIVSVTRQQVRIQVDGRENGRPVTRKKSNVRRIVEEEQ